MTQARPERSKPHGIEFEPEVLRWRVLLAILAVMVFLFATLNFRFFSVPNALTIVEQVAPVAILSIGMTYVLISGGIDLSVGSAIALVGAVSVIVLHRTNAVLGILAAITAGGMVGLVQGGLIGHLELPAFMVTLGTMGLFRGLTLVVTRGAPSVVEDKVFNYLGSARLGGVPVSLAALVLLYAAGHLLLTRSTYGRRLYAVGGNERAAKASGVSVGLNRMMTYIIGGILTGIAAVFTVGRLRSAQPLAGVGLEFEVITAVVLGGTSLNGGEGNVVGTLIGVAIVGILDNGLNMFGVSSYYQFLIKGIMVVAAVAADNYFRQNAHERSLRQEDGAAAERSHRSDGPADAEGAAGDGGRWDETVAGLSVLNITKTFPGVCALKDVSFHVKRGEVHAVLGENGAGKSTLINILSGVLQPDRGAIRIDGKLVSLTNPSRAREAGISTIHQEFSLIPELTVARNVFLGREPVSRSGFLDYRRMVEETRTVCEKLGSRLDAEARVGSLTVGQQQIVEIAKALSVNSWLVIMDEPTSALTEPEVEKLFAIIRQLRAAGVSVIYISHKLDEIFAIADRVTVMRDGQWVSTLPIEQVTHESLVELMVGRKLDLSAKRKLNDLGDITLEVAGLTKKGLFEDISFSVRAGEVVGMAGLLGAGRTEIGKCIFGLLKPDSGRVYVAGRRVQVDNPAAAMALGIAYAPEDRRREGLILPLSLKHNVSLPILRTLSRFRLVSEQRETALTLQAVKEFSIKAASVRQPVANLSGGNQQKVVLAKWLAISPRILILDEPTRGVDVGAKAEIRTIIEGLARQGLAILLISSELPELLGLCDRILVLHEGRVTAEYTQETASQQNIMMSATGVELA